MRKLIYGINLTLDGCCDHTKGVPDEAVHTYFTELMQTADLLVYGRKTYELMVPFWPDIAKHPTGTPTMDAFARLFDAVPKLVFSRTLDTAEDRHTRICNTDPNEELLRLKQLAGKDMLLGGVDLPSQLMQSGLIDEYHIVIHPVVAGAGRRLFDNISLEEQLPVQLAETKVLQSGCVALRYVKLSK